MVRSRAQLARVAAHLAVWAPFAYGLARTLQSGWVPTSDNSAIALRSWDVLTGHGPLVGQPTRLAQGVFDLGPLQYWLLTVPVHIDPGHGVLWGAALWCMLAGSLTVEAAWSAGRERAAIAASAVVVGAVLWIPDVAALPSWNPWFGLMFFLAALSAGWAVIAGHRGWSVVLVAAASIAAQAHLMYAVVAVAVVVLALLVALAGTIREKRGSYRWLIGAAIAGAACWAAPLIQQFTARTGNMTRLLAPPGPQVPTAGLHFGLKAIAAATGPPAYWWQPFPLLARLSTIDSHPAAVGVIAIVVLALVLVIALTGLRSRLIAGLAAVGLVLAGAVLVTFSAIPVAEVKLSPSTYNNLRYLLAPLYPLGIVAWLATAAAVAALAGRALRHARAGAPAPGKTPAPARAGAAAAGETLGPVRTGSAPAKTGSAPARTAGAVAAAVLVAFGVWTAAATNRAQAPENLVMKAVGTATRQIERQLPGQAVALTVLAPNIHYRRQLTLGLAYALRTKGYRPQVVHRLWAEQLGPLYLFRHKRIPVAEVHLSIGAVTVQVVKNPQPRWWLKSKPRLIRRSPA